MSISFRCPSCDKRFNVADNLAGKAAKCKCGQKFRIPFPPEAAPPQAAPLQPEPASQTSDSSFSDWLAEESQETYSFKTEESSQTSSDADAAAPSHLSSASQYVVQTRPRVRSSGDDGGSGGMAGFVVFVLIFGVGNAILYYTTGFLIIPIPRR